MLPNLITVEVTHIYRHIPLVAETEGTGGAFNVESYTGGSGRAESPAESGSARRRSDVTDTPG